MPLVPPKAFKFTAEPMPGGHFKLTYEEVFDDPDLVKRSLQLIAAMGGAKEVSVSSPQPDTIRIEAPFLTLEDLSNMMVSEFIQWAPMGQTRLAELLSKGSLARG